MNPDVVKPQGVFYNPTRLIVPRFLRSSVWSKETQCQPFWQDNVREADVASLADADADADVADEVVDDIRDEDADIGDAE